jgi:aspartate 1-decarboxylase
MREMFRAKIHRATVTEADLYYEGSITIDKKLMEAADILPHEKVQVVNLNNGTRLETYVIEGKADSGTVCLNGPAARLNHPGDTVIIIAYEFVTNEEARNHRAKVVHCNEQNKVVKIETQ